MPALTVAIGYHVQDGPWGGGNRFAKALGAALEARGDRVVYDLKDPAIDAILLTDPRARSANVSFAAGKVLRYLARRPEAIVFHRINECDERKGTRDMNRRLRRANYVADHTIFIASWLQDLDVWRRETPSSVVLNGGDTAVFNSRGAELWDHRGPLRLVTHHWGGNRMKGFDVYEEVDRLIGTPTWKDHLDFTYIGNLPRGFTFKNARHLPPMDGDMLADEIRGHHVYLTASINEPAGMHHIEGALCGLPLLYRDSGALPEYCTGFGEVFEDVRTFHHALGRMIQAYDEHRASLSNYDHTADRMCRDYLAVIDHQMADRDAVVAGRRLWRQPSVAIANRMAG